MSSKDPIKSKRVPRFVEEYCKDRNGTQAVIRAGYSPNEDAASVTAARLLGDARVQALIADQMAKISRECLVEAADVLREWIAIATADPSKIMHIRRVNCRCCHGAGHKYQWTEREYEEACEIAQRPVKRDEIPPPTPDCGGGFGWQLNAEPNPDCPECGGEGVEEVFFADTECLTGPERKLISGVKRTRDGIEVKMRDQDGALLNIARYLGMLVDKRELTGKDGLPLLTAAPPADLPTDPKQLGALYSQIVAE